MKLFLCEKPSQARDIANVIGITSKGNGFIDAGDNRFTWCFGHLIEQDEPESYDPIYKKWTVDHLPIIPVKWKSHVKKKATKQYNVIIRLIKSASGVVIATDADREGELIAWEILERSHYKGSVQRLWLSAYNEKTVCKALDSLKPADETKPLYFAALARQRADWMVGMNMTRAYTLYGRNVGLQSVLSVGRVQTPTLALVVNRDKEIEYFQSKPYFVNWIELESKTNLFKANLITNNYKDSNGFDDEGRCIDESLAKQVKEACHGVATISSAEYTEKETPPPLCFSLSELQKTCNKKWGYGSQEVLDIAQALYETFKLTTYPRTDCRYLSEDQFEEAPEILNMINQSGLTDSQLVNFIDPSIKSRIWNDSKVTAHHAIIPTGTELHDGLTLSEKQKNVFRLICQHYIAQFISNYVYLETVLLISASKLPFKATNQVQRSIGWKRVFGVLETEPEQRLPHLKAGDVLNIKQSGYDLKTTGPPKFFTEGTLIDAMKNVQRFVEDKDLKKILKNTEGIGTEVTRSGMIDALLLRKLIIKRKTTLCSTQLGKDLIALLPNELKDPVTTAMMERMLKQIADREVSYDEFMDRQIKWINALIDIVKQSVVETNQDESGDDKDWGECPGCGELLQQRHSNSRVGSSSCYSRVPPSYTRSNFMDSLACSIPNVTHSSLSFLNFL